jgi:hypothetical protein
LQCPILKSTTLHPKSQMHLILDTKLFVRNETNKA